MKTLLITSILILLAGCAPGLQQKPVTLSNGAQGIYIACNGSRNDWTMCYEMAAKSCGGKYTIIEKKETNTPDDGGPIVKRFMMVECPR